MMSFRTMLHKKSHVNDVFQNKVVKESHVNDVFQINVFKKEDFLLLFMMKIQYAGDSEEMIGEPLVLNFDMEIIKRGHWFDGIKANSSDGCNA